MKVRTTTPATASAMLAQADAYEAEAVKMRATAQAAALAGNIDASTQAMARALALEASLTPLRAAARKARIDELRAEIARLRPIVADLGARSTAADLAAQKALQDWMDNETDGDTADADKRIRLFTERAKLEAHWLKASRAHHEAREPMQAAQAELESLLNAPADAPAQARSGGLGMAAVLAA